MLKELGDVVVTGILAIQHFTKNGYDTKGIIQAAIQKLESRIPREW